MTGPETNTCRLCPETLPQYSGHGRPPRYCRNCQKHRNAARKQRQATPPEFIGVDGEGVDRPDGSHHYVLLSVGPESLWSANDDTSLTIGEILDFLWKQFLRHPKAVFCGFSLGYDFAQWVKTLPESRARRLFSSAKRAQRMPHGYEMPVEYGPWRLRALGLRRISIARVDDTRQMFVTDVFSHFQSSFAKAISDLPLDPQDRELIEWGKDNLRGIGERSEAMRLYNVTENMALSKLMDSRAQALYSEPLHIRLRKDRWYGPGPIVEKWFGQIDVPKSTALQECLPSKFLEFCRDSYVAGLFEIYCHGHVPGTSYGYDIHSAYPFIMSQLPCLMHSYVEYETGIPARSMVFDRKPNENVLFRGTIYGKNRYIGPAMHRQKDGRILRPKITTTYMWSHEIEASIRAGLVDQVDVIEAWRIRQRCQCPPPLADIERLYQQRLKVGKKTPIGISLKLAYNSGYGKFAQSIGLPAYANPVYASMITAGCRTMILNSIASHPDGPEAVMMIATDGIYFRTRHPYLEITDGKLGTWEETQTQNLTLWRPGIYWDDSNRQGNKLPKTRGIIIGQARKLIEQGDALWSDWKPHNPSDKDDWPSVTVTFPFAMVTVLEALNRNKWDTVGAVTHNDTRKQRTYPFPKRDPSSVYRDNDVWRCELFTHTGSDSAPYKGNLGLVRSDVEPYSIPPENWSEFTEALE